jgi:hypothetical protein
VSGSGASYDYKSGKKKRMAYFQTKDGLKIWTYAYAKTKPWFGDGKDSEYTRFRGFDYKILKVSGPDGWLRAADVEMDVKYAGTIDQFSSGVSPLAGGSVGMYGAHIVAGINEEHKPWDSGKRKKLWSKVSNPGNDFLETVIIAAASGALGGIAGGQASGKIAGELIGGAFEAYLAISQQAFDQTSCKEDVQFNGTVVLPSVYIEANKEYRAFISLDAMVKQVAAGLAAGYTEIDFYDRKPRNCDKGKIPERGIEVTDVRIKWKSEL